MSDDKVAGTETMLFKSLRSCMQHFYDHARFPNGADLSTAEFGLR